METKRSWLAFVEHTTSGRDQIHAIRPTRIGGLQAVIKTIDNRWKFNAELSNACIGDGSTFCFISRATKQYFIAHVGLHLPYICGVSLENVYSIEVNFALILLGKLVQGGNLPPKWRSGVAAKNQHNRPRSPERRQRNRRPCIQCFDREVRSYVANIKMASASLTPHCFKWEKEKGRHGHSGHDASKYFRRLPHGPADISEKTKPRRYKSYQGSGQPSSGTLLHCLPLLISSPNSSQGIPEAKYRTHRRRD